MLSLIRQRPFEDLYKPLETAVEGPLSLLLIVMEPKVRRRCIRFPRRLNLKKRSDLHNSHTAKLHESVPLSRFACNSFLHIHFKYSWGYG